MILARFARNNPHDSRFLISLFMYYLLINFEFIYSFLSIFFHYVLIYHPFDNGSVYLTIAVPSTIHSHLFIKLRVVIFNSGKRELSVESKLILIIFSLVDHQRFAEFVTPTLGMCVLLKGQDPETGIFNKFGCKCLVKKGLQLR